MAVRVALQEGPFSLRTLAVRAGVKYPTLRAWATGERNPRPANVARLLDALDAQADEIKELVRQARDAE